MSTRIEMYSLEWANVRALFGSGDELLVERALAGVEPNHVAPVRSILKRAVSSGVPFADLDSEVPDHVAAIYSLAMCVDHQYLETHGSSVAPLIDLTVLSSRLAREGGHFQAWFWRPLLGKTFETEQSYGWLEQSEVVALRDELVGVGREIAATPARSPVDTERLRRELSARCEQIKTSAQLERFFELLLAEGLALGADGLGTLAVHAAERCRDLSPQDAMRARMQFRLRFEPALIRAHPNTLSPFLDMMIEKLGAVAREGRDLFSRLA